MANYNQFKKGNFVEGNGIYPDTNRTEKFQGTFEYYITQSWARITLKNGHTEIISTRNLKLCAPIPIQERIINKIHYLDKKFAERKTKHA